MNRDFDIDKLRTAVAVGGRYFVGDYEVDPKPVDIDGESVSFSARLSHQAEASPPPRRVVSVVRPEVSCDEKTTKRIVALWSRLRTLSIPLIPEVVDIGDMSRPFVVLEAACARASLGQVLPLSRQLAPHQVITMIREIVGALIELRMSEISHGRLGLNSVFVRADARLETALPGLGAATLRDHMLDTDDSWLTALPYIAPDVVAGKTSSEASTANDVYALGGLVYALLTRRSPPPATNDHEAYVAMLVERIRRIRLDVPESVSNLLARCLAADPMARPNLEALDAALADAKGQASQIMMDEYDDLEDLVDVAQLDDEDVTVPPKPEAPPVDLTPTPTPTTPTEAEVAEALAQLKEATILANLGNADAARGCVDEILAKGVLSAEDIAARPECARLRPLIVS